MQISNPYNFNEEVINLLRDERVTHELALAVYAVIHNKAEQEDHSQEVFFHEISKELGMQDKSIMKAVEELTFAGYIR